MKSKFENLHPKNNSVFESMQDLLRKKKELYPEKFEPIRTNNRKKRRKRKK